MTDKHLSTQFDSDLQAVSARVLEMGGLAEVQVKAAVEALQHWSLEAAQLVIERERQINALEMQVDYDVSTIIGRRQPTARDLRLVIGISKICANLERIGDEAKKCAKRVCAILAKDASSHLPTAEIHTVLDQVLSQCRKALDAFARLDVPAAHAVIADDAHIDAALNSFMPSMIAFMENNIQDIGASVDLIVIARAMERIGDHAKNVAEQVLYIVQGDDVRHQRKVPPPAAAASDPWQ